MSNGGLGVRSLRSAKLTNPPVGSRSCWSYQRRAIALMVKSRKRRSAIRSTGPTVFAVLGPAVGVQYCQSSIEGL